jgi:hypothetical protein
MRGCDHGRPWASPVHASMTKKRHKFGIDGRILLVPIIFPCIIAIPFGQDFAHQLAFAALAAVLWLGAKVLWEVNPYCIDDFMAEVRFPAILTDDCPPRRRERLR